MSKPVIIEFGGKLRTLKLGSNAIVILEEMFGKPFTQIMQMDMGLRELRAILWAGLRHEDKELTPESVGDMMDDADMEAVVQRIFAASNEATGPQGAPTTPNRATRRRTK